MSNDTRPDRRSNRRAEVAEAETGAPRQATLPGMDLERAMQATAAKGLERRAFKGGSANSQTLLRMSAKLGAVLWVRLQEALDAYKAAVAAELATKPGTEEALQAKRESRAARQVLREVRQTSAVATGVTGQYIRAARVIAGADLDKNFDRLVIEGTEMLDDQVGDGGDEVVH